MQALLGDLTSGDDCRAEDAIKSVAEKGSQGIPVLRDLLSAAETDVRWWATWALSESRAPESQELLRQMMHDPEISVRQCAALALRQKPDPLAIPELTAGLSDNDSVLARLCGAALIAIGKEAVPALIEVLENGPQAAKLEAARSLAMIGDQSSIPALFAALQKDSALMEYWASEGLDRMGVGMSFFKT